MKRLVLAVLAAAGMLVGLALPAQADVYGWKWNQTTLTVSDGTHTTQVKDAITRWDAVTPLDIHKASGQTDVTVNWGNVYPYAGTADWTWTNGQVTHCTVVIDQRFKARSLRLQWATPIALHELGHCWGLAHTTDLTIPSVMDAVMVSNYQYPQPYDVGQLALLYGS